MNILRITKLTNNNNEFYSLLMFTLLKSDQLEKDKRNVWGLVEMDALQYRI